MKRLNILPLVAACSLLAGCGALKRLGTDAAVVVTSPVTVPLAAAYDSLNWGKDTKHATPVVLFPLNWPLHAAKHIAYSALHLGDAVISPFYLLACITPGNDLVPLDLYSLSDGYPWKSAPWPSFED